MKFIFSILLLIVFQSHSQADSKSKLSKDYFVCKTDLDCVLVSGWCSYFAINKGKLDLFNKIPDDETNPEGKNPKNACPPGWAPMKMPKPVCLKKECSTMGGIPGV
jgi:hypothetical protein